MAVDLTQSEIDLFEKHGINSNNIKETVNNYRSDGLSDDDIRAKIDDKLNSWKQPSNNNNTQNKVLSGGISQTANWDKKGNVYYTDVNGNKINDKGNLNPLEKLGRKAQAAADNISDWINNTNPKSEAYKQKAETALSLVTLPFTGGAGLTKSIAAKLAPATGKAIAKATAQGITGGGVSGAAFGGLNGLVSGVSDEKKAPEIAAQSAIQSLTGGGLGALTGGVLGFGGSKILQGIKGLKNVPKKAAAVPERNITDHSADGLSDTTVSSTKNSPENITPPKKVIRPKNTEYNKTAINKFNDYIDSQKYQGGNLDVQKGRVNNKFYQRTLNNENNDIELASRKFNEISDKIKKNPEILNNADEVSKMEQELSQMQVPEEFANDMFNRFYNIVGGSDKMLSREFKQSRLPKNANLPKEIEKAVKKNPPEYEVLHNKNLIAQAVKDIENDPELSQKLLNKAVSGDKNNKEFSALEFEQTRQLIDKLYSEGKNEEALNLTRLVSEAGSRAGQAVQAMSLWKRTTPAGAVKNAQHIIDEFNQTVKDPKKQIKLTDENINKIKELTENIHKAPEGREKDVATALLLKYEKELIPPSMSNKLKTLRNMSLLLNPKTFNRNLTGNAIFGGVENLLAKPLAAGIDKLISPITKQRTRVLPKGGTYLKGLWQGLKEGNEDVLKGINTRDKIGQRFDIQRKSFDKGLLGGLETALNWSLQVPDRMFYQAAFNESLANQMAAAGTKKATNDMLKRAEQEALEAVFQNNSALSNGVTGLRKVLNGNGNFGLGDAAIPYAQTPANITQQSINYSPFGYTKAIGNLLKGDQRQAALDAARATIGTGIIGGGYELGKHGIISAIDRDDYDVQKNYAAAGTRPYSLKLPNGNRISGLSMLAPIGTTLVAGAALNDIDKNGDYKNALNSSIDTLLEASYLQTLQKMAEDTREGDWIGAAMEPVLGLPSQFVPTALNQINAYVDPYSRETRNDNPLIKSYNQAINKIPFASKTLPIKYDVTGEPIKRYDREGIAKLYDVSLNPFYYNTQKDNPELKEVLRLYEQTGDKGVLYNTPPSTVRFKALNGEQKNIKLTGKDYSEYQKTAGKISSNTLKKIINSNIYKNLPDDKKAELIKITHQKAEELTKETLFDKPNAKVRGALRKLSTREMKTAEEKAVDDIFKTVKKMFKAADLTDDYNLDFSFPIQRTDDNEE